MPRPAFFALAALTVACQAGRPPSQSPTPASAADQPGPPTERPHSPLTARETALVKELRRDVEQLAASIGERNADKKWELASASDYVAGELEAAGYYLERQGFEVGEIVAQNLGVELKGGGQGDDIVVVGAHYDSAPGTPGADDNASGTAALLALARTLKDARPARTLRLVAFANQEAPYFKTPGMGSLVYAKRSAARGERIIAMISIESIGYYSDTPGSQRTPSGLSARYPSVGDFVAVVGNEGSRPLVDRVLRTFLSHASIGAQGAASSPQIAGVSVSDHWAFWQVGYQAVMLTDTADFRNPHHHAAGDTPDKLDFERMARVVAGLEGVIGELAGI
jgi:hypothetical protein